MGTYNAQDYLAHQLESIAGQSCIEWTVWISDDGSQDDSLPLIASFQQKWGTQRLKLVSGPGQGFAANFMSLVFNTDIQAEYYAFADQDDIWEPNKLSRALSLIQQTAEDHPAMYCSRTRIVDQWDRELGFSPLFTRPPSFANALIQSLGGANTMIFNHAARRLLVEAGQVNIISHDWWAYLVIAGCGGDIIYDEYPSVRYRQHARNVVGTNTGLRNKWVRLRKLWQGEFRNWIDCNITALNRLSNRLKPENRRLLHTFTAARNAWLLPRLMVLSQSGIYRQTLLGNLGLLFAALFKKI